jgi:Acetyltransferase (GNAT) domain
MTSPAPATNRLTATLEPIRGDLAVLAGRWQALSGRAGPAISFFLSWPWISTWLSMMPTECQPHLLAIQDRDRPGADLGLAILCPRRHVRSGLFVSRQWLLHQSGNWELDRIMVEYNGVLTEGGGAAGLLRAGLDALGAVPGGCDELVLPGVDPVSGLLSQTPNGWWARQIHADICPYVELDLIGSGIGDGADAGKAWPRRGPAAAIRRAQRLYQPNGPLAFQIAGTESEALAYFDGLIALHQADWNSRGLPGAFASPVFTEFHRRLISAAFPGGHIQLARLTVDQRAIGYLYNFVWHGTVYAYQSGFERPHHDNRLKPGLLTHHAAILANARLGHRRYEFMAGEGRQKRAFATGEGQLVWLALERDTVAKRVEHVLRQSVAKVRTALWPA